MSTDIPLIVENHSGIPRAREPVTVGIPLPKGTANSPAHLFLVDAEGRPVLLQAHDTARWSDGSLKWVLLDFLADAPAFGRAEYRIRVDEGGAGPAAYDELLMICESNGAEVRTGRAVFRIAGGKTFPFSSVSVGGQEILGESSCGTVAIDEKGREFLPCIDGVVAEAGGPVRATVNVSGAFRDRRGIGLADFFARLSFFVGMHLAEIQITVRNPRAAQHPRGLWDLGDEGSVYLRDLSLRIALRTNGNLRTQWMAEPLDEVRVWPHTNVRIYQDSSGGQNWRSSNHVNRFSKVPNVFRGYRVTAAGEVVRSGERATPIMGLSSETAAVVSAIDQFWQNFPKLLEVEGNTVRLGLFPDTYQDAFELQGGEQKTHTLWVQFGAPEASVADLRWSARRLVVRSRPDWYAAAQVVPFLMPKERQPGKHPALSLVDKLTDSAIVGTNTFFHRREVIDEYGWRHFGDLYADHEAVNQTGGPPLVAHYNNQYDVIHGALLQYCRSGDHRWFTLADDLAKHVIDIDIYHTREDRPAVNGGLFWHTDHYTDAGTATHRAYSRTSPQAARSSGYGGGPACEHNYTTGLLYYYYLTGNPQAFDSVISLADWVINMDDGSQRTLGFLDPRPTGYCTLTATPGYHGPGRGAGNSINALIDAYTLTGTPRYLNRAEQLIRRCIHPNDDIEDRELDDVERRWSYTVFLSVLGRYLDVKAEQEACDYMYAYARASLLHYARWMLDHEVPYKSVLHKVEIPTETWPAQDIRKCGVFHWAAKHASGELQAALREKAEFYFNTCVRDLLSFPTHTLTRPIVILMANAYIHAYCLAHGEGTAPEPAETHGFGKPAQFKWQFYEAYRIKDGLRRMIGKWKDAKSRLGIRMNPAARKAHE